MNLKARALLGPFSIISSVTAASPARIASFNEKLMAGMMPSPEFRPDHRVVVLSIVGTAAAVRMMRCVAPSRARTNRQRIAVAAIDQAYAGPASRPTTPDRSREWQRWRGRRRRAADRACSLLNAAPSHSRS